MMAKEEKYGPLQDVDWFSFLISVLFFFCFHNILHPRTAKTAQHKTEFNQLQNNHPPSRNRFIITIERWPVLSSRVVCVWCVCERAGKRYCVCAINTFFSIHWLRQVLWTSGTSRFAPRKRLRSACCRVPEAAGESAAGRETPPVNYRHLSWESETELIPFPRPFRENTEAQERDKPTNRRRWMCSGNEESPTAEIFWSRRDDAVISTERDQQRVQQIHLHSSVHWKKSSESWPESHFQGLQLKQRTDSPFVFSILHHSDVAQLTVCMKTSRCSLNLHARRSPTFLFDPPAPPPLLLRRCLHSPFLTLHNLST